MRISYKNFGHKMQNGERELGGGGSRLRMEMIKSDHRLIMFESMDLLICTWIFSSGGLL
jgi:hypothetical protein